MELTISIPEKYIVSYSPDELKLLLKLNTAIDMYRSGQISSGAAVEFIGEIDRFEFLYECKKKALNLRRMKALTSWKMKLPCLIWSCHDRSG